MTRTDLPPAIRSRPRYGRLSLQPGSAHLIVADGEGAGAIIDLLENAEGNHFQASQTRIIYVTGANGTDMSKAVLGLGMPATYHAPTLASAMPRLRKILTEAHMGLQVYLAGTESLIGIVQKEVEQAGLPFTAVQTEHRGSLARRVQCVHCKGITEDVTTDPFKCGHCGLHLFVRDHYSRRIAAFQGVCIDAEDPGERPEPVVKFP